MTVTMEAPVLGEGAYTFPEALTILRGVTRAVTATQLRRWMATGLAPVAMSGAQSKHRILSFDDLVTLAIISRFREHEVSLQRVRRLEAERPNQRAWAGAIRSFAEEIRFGEDLHTEAWDLTPWVEIDPQVQFGMPVVRGTRVPVKTVIANLEVGSPKDVAEWHGLTVDQVIGARDYVAVH
jgi:uncharacterized protein (DUF433 family)